MGPIDHFLDALKGFEVEELELNTEAPDYHVGDRCFRVSCGDRLVEVHWSEEGDVPTTRVHFSPDVMTGDILTTFRLEASKAIVKYLEA